MRFGRVTSLFLLLCPVVLAAEKKIAKREIIGGINLTDFKDEKTGKIFDPVLNWNDQIDLDRTVKSEIVKKLTGLQRQGYGVVRVWYPSGYLNEPDLKTRIMDNLVELLTELKLHGDPVVILTWAWWGGISTEDGALPSKYIYWPWVKCGDDNGDGICNGGLEANKNYIDYRSPKSSQSCHVTDERDQYLSFCWSGIFTNQMQLILKTKGFNIIEHEIFNEIDSLNHFKLTAPGLPQINAAQDYINHLVPKLRRYASAPCLIGASIVGKEDDGADNFHKIYGYLAARAWLPCQPDIHVGSATNFVKLFKEASLFYKPGSKIILGEVDGESLYSNQETSCQKLEVEVDNLKKSSFLRDYSMFFVNWYGAGAVGMPQNTLEERTIFPFGDGRAPNIENCPVSPLKTENKKRRH